jgi:hypothetical protein
MTFLGAIVSVREGHALDWLSSGFVDLAILYNPEENADLLIEPLDEENPRIRDALEPSHGGNRVRIP